MVFVSRNRILVDIASKGRILRHRDGSTTNGEGGEGRGSNGRVPSADDELSDDALPLREKREREERRQRPTTAASGSRPFSPSTRSASAQNKAPVRDDPCSFHLSLPPPRSPSPGRNGGNVPRRNLGSYIGRALGMAKSKASTKRVEAEMASSDCEHKRRRERAEGSGPSGPTSPSKSRVRVRAWKHTKRLNKARVFPPRSSIRSHILWTEKVSAFKACKENYNFPMWQSNHASKLHDVCKYMLTNDKFSKTSTRCFVSVRNRILCPSPKNMQETRSSPRLTKRRRTRRGGQGEAGRKKKRPHREQGSSAYPKIVGVVLRGETNEKSASSSSPPMKSGRRRRRRRLGSTSTVRPLGRRGGVGASA